MRVFENLEPKDVFYYFEEICNIPHGSGNIRQISDYLADFAKKRNLEYYQDEIGNVIIIKEASEGYENHKPVMLQGHMDMVAVKKPNYEMDMEREGLRLKVSGDKVYAEGTSLGGDDGIAVAYGLALLDGTYHHPRIELVVTVDEEVGMDGARVLDMSPCKATTLVNLDSEEEGIFLTGCAGGARVNYHLQYTEEKKEGYLCKLRVFGLMGGHSGAEIHKERGNANCLLGRVLSRLSEQFAFRMITLEGGLADNAIPREAAAELLITGWKTDCQGEEKKDMKEVLSEKMTEQEKALLAELSVKDAGVRLEAVLSENKEEYFCMDEALSKRITALLNILPYGVQAMSSSLPGLVETSLNLGILSAGKGSFHTGISVRSSFESAKEALIDKLKSIAYLTGVEAEVTGDYPGWAYRENSPLRDKMTEVYEAMYGKKPEIQAIHAGLECGIFAHKIPDLDCVSIGPEMQNIHTTEEELSISSTKRVWEFLIKLLAEM